MSALYDKWSMEKRKEAVRRRLDKVSLIELLTKFGILNLTHPP